MRDRMSESWPTRQSGWRIYRSKCQSLIWFVEGGRRIIDQPAGAFVGFCDGCLFRCKDHHSVSWSPRLTLILAIDPKEWAPRFIRRGIDLTSGCSYCETFIVVNGIHISILARYDRPRPSRGFFGPNLLFRARASVRSKIHLDLPGHPKMTPLRVQALDQGPFCPTFQLCRLRGCSVRKASRANSIRLGVLKECNIQEMQPWTLLSARFSCWRSPDR
jgi:hypothetical protein